MKAYIFVVRANGTAAEKLGAMALPTDTEAITFAKHIVQDLFEYGGADDYVGHTLDIIEGARVVSSVPIIE